VVIGEYGVRISDQTARGPDGGGSIAARERLCNFLVGRWGCGAWSIAGGA
jgi:hypothetical protein